MKDNYTIISNSRLKTNGIYEVRINRPSATIKDIDQFVKISIIGYF